jgi:hypothetical protein
MILTLPLIPYIPAGVPFGVPLAEAVPQVFLKIIPIVSCFILFVNKISEIFAEIFCEWDSGTNFYKKSTGTWEPYITNPCKQG